MSRYNADDELILSHLAQVLKRAAVLSALSAVIDCQGSRSCYAKSVTSLFFLLSVLAHVPIVRVKQYLS